MKIGLKGKNLKFYKDGAAKNNFSPLQISGKTASNVSIE